LVDGGLVYAAAGLSSEVDGGMIIRALNPSSGKIVWTQRQGPRGGGKGFTGRLLVKNGPVLQMGTQPVVWTLDPKTGATKGTSDGGGRKNQMVYDRSWRWLETDCTINRFFEKKPLSKGRGTGQLLVFGPKANYCYHKHQLMDRRWVNHVSAHEIKFKWGNATYWRQELKNPRQIEAMIIAGDVLFTSGSKNRYDPKKGAFLEARSSVDGKVRTLIELDSPPTLEGMAAANGRLYMTTRDGKLRCFGKM